MASAPGTPTRRTARATNAKNALTKSPNDRRRIVTGCGVRFLGAVVPDVLPVELDELEVRRRGMAGVLGSCMECGEANCGPRGVLSLQRSY
ncbi:carboxyvinyl-carboxyphosphonate phosphorylmutase [Streptomyces azureus]|uniref:Carboxyvinyl-carboxyphosphonate phosphorylmutase n=1 Tax=Streptomyces azureus TaxID=146537 RepID=A0A0K8PYZ8_STRAJ|nr:carboxyvinyl-carboxyphosphonate phosphorylmutase [Streptomyces azureus]